MTARGRRLVAGAVLALSFAAGASAQHWNPYTRQLDAVSVQLAPGVEEDMAVCAGTREIAYEASSDGAIVTCSTDR